MLREKCPKIVAMVESSIKSDPITSVVRHEFRDRDLLRIMDAPIESVDVDVERNGLKSDHLGLGAEHGRRRQTLDYDARMIVQEFQRRR